MSSQNYDIHENINLNTSSHIEDLDKKIERENALLLQLENMLNNISKFTNNNISTPITDFTSNYISQPIISLDKSIRKSLKIN